MTPNWAGPVDVLGSPSTATRVTLGAICLSSSSHFPLMLYSNSMKPVALRPGRARLSTKPPATGSAMIGNTIGTVRVACINGPTVEVPGARMTSGASAANSAACLRISGGPVDIDPDVAAFDPTEVLQRLPECADPRLILRVILGYGQEYADKAHPLRLLPSRCERPCRSASEQRDELAPRHSITSSAIASSDGGTVRLSIVAV